jgi:hypothetical protein
LGGERKVSEEERIILEVNSCQVLAAMPLQIRLHIPLSSHLSILTCDCLESVEHLSKRTNHIECQVCQNDFGQ